MPHSGESAVVAVSTRGTRVFRRSTTWDHGARRAWEVFRCERASPGFPQKCLILKGEVGVFQTEQPTREIVEAGLERGLGARSVRSLQSVAVHLELEHAAGDAELLRGARLVPARTLQGVEQQLSLEAPDRLLEAEATRAQVLAQGLDLAGADHGLGEVLELQQVARGEGDACSMAFSSSRTFPGHG